MIERVEVELDGKQLIIETGKMAKQAHGSVTVRSGDTVVLVTVVVSREKREVDFLPLYVDYREMTYAAGKIPGGFFKREGRPSEKEVLTSRLIDRPQRPLFAEGFRNEVQIMAVVLSADKENNPDVLAMAGASAALAAAGIEVKATVGSVRVGRVDGQFVVNPTHSQMEKSDIDLVVATTGDNVAMVEGSASEVPEEVILEAIQVAREGAGKIVAAVEELRAKVGAPRREVALVESDPELVRRVREFVEGKDHGLGSYEGKDTRRQVMEKLQEETLAHLGEEAEERKKEIRGILETLEKEAVRARILQEGIRPDGRRPEDLREINCEVGLLPRTHGSALFTRGETQSLAVTTLGTSDDEQKMDKLTGEEFKSFMLHYNFPPYSVGEVKPIRGPGRREVGHGVLAERALIKVFPEKEDFPYTVRLVSDILESNGSSSMATVCGGSLSLMDAGVPVKRAVAGVSTGLVMGEGEKAVLLTDIMGLEDHYGDMDFKVAGTREGVTAIQMDIKVAGISWEILSQGLERARETRLAILEKMEEALPKPRGDISVYAPRILIIKIKPPKVPLLIGPAGKTVRGIIAKTGAQINIEDDGTVSVASTDEAKAREALEMIKTVVAEVEVGKIYKGKVKRIMNFGAFVEVLPRQEGLVHISKIADHRVERVEDELKEGDEIEVKVVEIDSQGRINLSAKGLSRPQRSQGGSGPAGDEGSQPPSGSRDRRPPSGGPPRGRRR